MKFGSREGGIRWRQRLLSPFSSLAYRIKSSCQSFVIKTIEKHGFSAAALSGESELQAVVKMLQRQPPRHRDPFPAANAIAVQDYLLCSHPRVDFFYHRPVDLVETPRILTGDYEPDVTAWLCTRIHSDSRVLVIGGRQGYHVLTMAERVGRSAAVMVLHPDAAEREVMELNLQVNRLSQHVQVSELSPHELTSSTPSMLSQIAKFAPNLVLVDVASFSSPELGGAGLVGPDCPLLMNIDAHTILSGQVTSQPNDHRGMTTSQKAA